MIATKRSECEPGPDTCETCDDPIARVYWFLPGFHGIRFCCRACALAWIDRKCGVIAAASGAEAEG